MFSLDELAKQFSLDHVHKAGARFDPEKAKWFNHQYLVKRSNEELSFEFEKILKQKGIHADFEYINQVVGLIKERVNFVHEMWPQASFFFVAPESYDAEVIKKRWKDNVPVQIAELKDILEKSDSFTAEGFKETVHHFVEEKQANMGSVMNCLRLALVGGSFGPDLPVIAEFLGKDEVVKRIESALAKIK